MVLLLSLFVFSALAQGAQPGHAGHPGSVSETTGFFQKFLKVYTPRRQCMDNEQPLVWLHLVADLLIAASYYSIPFALIVLVRKRRDLHFNWIFYMFAAFILACGTTHLFNIWALWQPFYKVDGLFKLFTGLVSGATAVMLWPLIPKALSLPSRASLQAEVKTRTAELQDANAALTRALRDQERVQKALEQSEERFQIAVRATNDAIWDWNLTNDTLWWNDGVQTLFAYSAQEIGPGISWWYDHVHPEDMKRVVNGIHGVIDGSEAFWRDEYRFRRADGGYAIVFDRGFVIRDSDGKAVRMIGAMQDVTESRRAAQALAESEARFRAAVGAVSSLLWTNNPRGEMEGPQPGWANFTGQSYEEYQGYGWAKAVHPNDAQPTINAWNEAVTGKRMFEFEHRLRRSDNAWRLCSIRAVPVLDKMGEVREWVGVHTDITEQRQAEEALRESEERYRLFIANSSEGVWRMEFHPPLDTLLTVDEQVECAYRDGRMAECNDAMARMYGLMAAQDLLGKSLAFMLPADDPAARGFLTSIISAGYRVTDLESAERDASGNVVYFSNSMAGVVEQNRLLRIWGTQRDITRRKHAEDALRRERERLSLALTAGRMGVYDLNLLEDKLWWSPEIYSVFGVSPADSVPTRELFTALVHPDDRQPFWDRLDQSIIEGRTFTHEFRIVRPDGGLRWIANRALTEKDSSGVAVRHFGIALDITERKRAEEALLENEAVLRTVTSEAQVGLVMVDKDRRYLFANHTYAEILGLPNAEIVGKRVPDILPHVYDQIQPRLDLAFAGERVTYELRVSGNSAANENRFYEVVYEPRTNNTHEPYVVVVIVDITERKRMQHTLEQLVEERTAKLRETVGELEAFSYSIAHDMRAPLRAMQGFSQLLQEEYGEQIGQGKDYLRRIAASASRLDALIQDVLNYSKIVRAELLLTPVNTEELMLEILESYPNLQTPNVDIELISPIPAVLANPAALTQVFSNLLGNAVKFVEHGRKPKVRVWAEPASNGFIRIWFEDNGIGIPKEAQDRIFVMFQRLNPPGEYEGTGIGLTIVRKAVERMGGKVGLESGPERGTRFWIELKQKP